MKHAEKNQLFIDSIEHWTVNGVELFLDDFEPIKIDGKSITYWADSCITKEFKLNGSYCPLCVNFSNDCSVCFLAGVRWFCCVSYQRFIANPSLITCEAVITELWDTAQNTINYKDKFYHERVISNLKNIIGGIGGILSY